MSDTPATRQPRHRGRFAPSPTGPLHFGSLVAALASCCDARHACGEWLLRIEDVDLTRARPDAERGILTTLEHCGFTWDGPVLRQSDSSRDYEAALAALRSRGLAYACTCVRRELADARFGAGGERVYPGTCREGSPPARGLRTAHAWRLRVGETPVAFRDRLQGPQQQCLASEVGDFVVKRADGLFAYQLAVVVDDALQGITHVVRGADLLASTPRQIFLQRLMGYPTPEYLHLPVALGAAGEKLSKQTGAARIGGDAIGALRAAWAFLEQPLPTGSAAPATVAEFWSWAIAAWDVRRLPPVAMLPAPPAFAAPGSRPV